MAESVNTPAEVWRAIPGKDGYEVSSLGRVRSLGRVLQDGRRRSGQMLKPWLAGSGYHYVSLGGDFKIGVHRLVALVFHGEPVGCKNEAAHLNGNPKDNRVENIVWASRSENEQHKRQHGTYARPVVFKQPHHKKRGPKPTRHPRADEMIAMRKAGATIEQVGAAVGLSKSGAYDALRNR